MVKLYLACDTGPSGMGVVARGFINHLLNRDIELSVKTHFWGWNKEGFEFQTPRKFVDTRFKEKLFRSGRINEDYLIEEPREATNRTDINLTKNLNSNTETEPQECIIRDFEGKEDIWLTVGGMNFAEQAPQDDGIYTIVETDWNLDVIPRKWEHYLKQVDECWVPNQWNYNAFKNRLGEDNPLMDKVKIMPYGVPFNYEPTEYDCEVCPNQHRDPNRRSQQCLKDEKFNFLIISRFYHIKGLYRMIKAFVREFKGREPVRLFLKTTSNQQFDFNEMGAIKQIINEIGVPDPPEIGTKRSPLKTQRLYDLLGHADCLLQVSRAECVGIAPWQAMHCRTPVIVTDWSAFNEELNSEGSGAMDDRGVLKVEDYEVETPRSEVDYIMYAGSADYPPDSKWAVPSLGAIQKEMRRIFQRSKEERREMGKKAREQAHEKMSWSNFIDKRVERLKEVGE